MLEFYLGLYTSGESSAIFWMFSVVIGFLMIQGTKEDLRLESGLTLNPLLLLLVFIGGPFYLLWETFKSNTIGSGFNIVGRFITKLSCIVLIIVGTFLVSMFAPGITLFYTIFYLMGLSWNVFIYMLSWRPKKKVKCETIDLIDPEEFNHDLYMNQQKYESYEDDLIDPEEFMGASNDR